MSGPSRPGDTFDVHHVLRTTVTEDGVVMLNIGDARGEISADERVPLFQAPGVLSLPANPSPGSGGAEVMCLETSSGYIGICARDNRKAALAGNVKQGETVVFASGSQACSIYKNDGSVTHMTTENGQSSGPTIYERMAPDGFVRFARWGKETFDPTGFHIFTFSGARLDMGGIGGLPAPFSSLGSYARLSAKMVSIEGSVVALGPRTGLADTAAKATPALAAIAALNSVLTALVAPGAYVSASPGSPSVPGPGLLAAISAAQTVLGAMPTTLPSNCVTVT